MVRSAFVKPTLTIMELIQTPRRSRFINRAKNLSGNVFSTVFIVMILGFGVVRLSAEPPAGQNYIGINIGSVSDWEGNIIFADAMKQARGWAAAGSNGNTALPATSLDGNGWPTVDASVYVWAGLSRDNSGTYALSFESNSASPVVSVMYYADAVKNVSRSGNVTTAQVVLPNAAICVLNFANTSGGVRNVKLMRPIAPGSTTSHAMTDSFSQPFLNAIAPFHALRFMDYSAAYGNPQVEWSERVQPNSTSYNRNPDGYSWLGSGGPWEYVILLCNQAHKDAWICVPFKASDDYIHQLAKLFRSGNAFTGNAGLDPSLKLYVEFDNEVWNVGPFDGNANHDLAKAEVEAGDSNGYTYDGEPNDWNWTWRRTARRAADISLIFRQEFGDAAMMTQVRPVFEWQLGRAATGSDPLQYLENFYIPKVAAGEAVSYLFYGGGGSAYYNPAAYSASLTLENFWQSESMDVSVWSNPTGAIAIDTNVCATFGIKRLAYEGGPSLDHTKPNVDSIEAVKAQAWADPRMGNEMTEHHNAWSNCGGDLLMYYTLRPKDYQWGFTQAIDDLTLPKYIATAALAAAPRAAITLGHSLPAIVPGNSYDLKNWSAGTSWMGSSVSLASGQWTAYVFNIPQDGAYDVSAPYSSGGGGRLSFIVDGVEGAYKTATGSGSLAANITLTK